MFQAVPQQQFPVQQSPSPPMDNMSTLPPNALVTTNAAGEQKPRKLRASCDACSRAKVKCDKVRHLPVPVSACIDPFTRSGLPAIAAVT